ncbi:probable sugar phosphate/phosphate translocator At3g11320 isoform X8 [Lycium barbarum]|uniref:probable sugar phosphate/phosphate translocator At3g11320 isoform X8 n=1 Tax=Lycium barbarum TaxID=112863 RepID=UPI00293EFA95|nr:probable sugar phosphate/phosphate translocator At3g11320 isoform X8 [Lycium barbarum]
MTLQSLFDNLIISEGSPLTCKDWCSLLNHLFPAAFDETDYSCCGLRNRLGFPGEGILILCRSFNYGKGEPSFHLFGFIMCVGATAARALKSVLQGILLFSKGEKLNSMNLLLYMAPIAVVFLLPATLSMEENVVGITLALARDNSRIIWLLLFNSAVAYFVNLTNFMVTKHR